MFYNTQSGNKKNLSTQVRLQVAANSTKVSSTGSINTHNDVSVTSPVTNQILQYDSGNWVNKIIADANITLSDINEISVNSVNNDEIFQYNSISSKWENKSLSEAGFVSSASGINNTVIGNQTPSTGAFTTLSSASLNSTTLNTTGNVGIGITTPNCRLHVKSQFTDYGSGNIGTSITQASLLLENSLSSFAGCAMVLQRVNSTTGRLSFQFSSTSNINSYEEKGYLQSTSSNYGLLTFTGQHRNLLNTNIDSGSAGLIVSSTGEYINLDNSLNITITESLPICALTTVDNDKKVFGVISDKEDTDTTRTQEAGAFVTPFSKANQNEQRMFINSLGEGGIWVCNKNGTIENGDYITSSSVPGYGMKQTLNENLLANHTVAKITCDCDFSLTKIVKQKLKVITSTGADGNSVTNIDYDSKGDVQYEDDLDSTGAQQMIYKFDTRFLQTDGTQLTETEYTTKVGQNETVYIACFVGCTYHCG
jgi:hypothetical protein